MSRSGSVTFVWGDGPHKFRMGVGEIVELEEKCDMGSEEILRRINNSNWRIIYLRETIRLGLIGGGMKPEAAFKLRERYASEPPFAPLIDVARIILETALIGARDGEKPGKARAATVGIEPPSDQMESSPSPPSTAQPLQ